MNRRYLGFALLVLTGVITFLFFYKPSMPLGQRRAHGIQFVNEGVKVDRKPCFIRGYHKARESWDLLCSRYPFKAGAHIKISELRAMEKIGIYCPGWKLPTVDKMNELCDYYCKE